MAGDNLPARVVKALVRRRKSTPQTLEPGRQDLIDPPAQNVNVPPPSAPESRDRAVVIVFNQQINNYHAPPTAPAASVAPPSPPTAGPRPRLFRPSVTGEMIEQAAKMRREAVMRLLRNYYPMVYRVAAALSGKEKSALKIARLVVDRSFNAMGQWSTPAEAENWFLRNTIQVVRQSQGRRADSDCLVRGKDAGGAAFVRALRGLPFQQVEAFMLHHGERLEARGIAIAMDCSISASVNHLAAANKALQAMAGEDFNRLAANLADSYALLEPRSELIEGELAWPVARRMATRRIVRLVVTAVVLGIIAGAAWVAWKVVPKLSI